MELETGLHYPISLRSLPRGWSAGYLGDFSLAVQSGFACGKHSEQNIGVAHLRPMNISREGKLDLSAIKYVQTDADSRRLEKDDVLFNNTNSPELIGKSAWIGEDGAGLACSNHMTRIRFNELVMSKFGAIQLHFLWMSGYFLHHCVKHVNQASVSSRNLARTVPFVAPPLNEQHRIVDKIEELFSHLDQGIENLKHTRTQLKVYRQALLKAAFEGRLSEQWRKDNADKRETAEQLLARIRTEREARYQQQLEDWKQAVAKWEKNGKPGKKTAKPKKPKEFLPLTEVELADLPKLPEGWVWVRLGNVNVEVFDGPFGSNLKGSDYVDSGVRVI